MKCFLSKRGGRSIAIVLAFALAMSFVAPFATVLADGGHVGNVLHITGRANSWDGVDILRDGMEVGDILVVEGRIDGAAPEGAQMVMGGAESPWNWIRNTSVTEANQSFAFEVVLDENHIEADQFVRIRIQTNGEGSAMPFFIYTISLVRNGVVVFSLADNTYLQAARGETELNGVAFLQRSGGPTVTVTTPQPHREAVVDGTEADAAESGGPLGPLENLHLITFDPESRYEGYISAGDQMEGEVVERDGNYVFRLENVTGNYTSGDGNYLHFVLPAPLPMGSTVEISWDVFVPSEENPGDRNIVGPGININGQFGSAPHQPTNVPHGEQPSDLDRTIAMDEWITTTVEFTTGLAVGDIEFLIFRFRVNNDTQQPSVLYIDNISISTRGVEDVFVPTFDLDAPSLAELFADYFMVGNIWSNAIQMGMGNTEEAFAHHFNAITAENHHKPSFIAGTGPDPATWNFETQDAIVDFAEAHGLAMVGHTLVWHAQSPAWLTNVPGTTEPLTRAEAMANMELYISTVAGRYAGRMQAWDVLNEAIASSVGEFSGDWRNHLRTNLNLDGGQIQWYAAFANGAVDGEAGYDFIFYAFYFARQADPHATLFYNDYNEEQPGKSMAIADMVMYFNERWENHPSYDGRLLIEGIGMQSHHHLDQWATNFDNIRPAIERFVATGAVLAVTELDITVGTQADPSIPLSPEQEARQAEAYARVFGYFMEFADYIERVSIWGKADNQSWRAWGSPLLFDSSFEAKEAFDAIVSLVDVGAIAFDVAGLEFAFSMTIGSISGFADLLTGENLEHFMDVPAQVINGEVYVPIRALFLAFGNDASSLSWDSEAGEAVIMQGDVEYRIIPSHIVNNRAMVSLESLYEDGMTIEIVGNVIIITVR
ncbi:MAG: endo-1,4-beta-xylanase [Defluviitaleaceae bacterium]|nr:endo-1,4-beta-xylanase [Defluviitaleaceae bacterium]